MTGGLPVFDGPFGALGRALSAEAGRAYCLTPINMVPNGPPHLGHVSGPLLRMDVLRRHLLRGGADVVFVTTTDVHETHVVVKAREQERSPEAVANDYHARIHADLAGLDIAYDALINPLDPGGAEAYGRITDALIGALVAAGTTDVLEETLPVRGDTGEFVLGGWLAGTCPHCRTALVSFFCEGCGSQTEPAALIDPHHRIDAVGLDWRRHRSLFLSPGATAAVRAHLEKMALRPDFRAIAERYLAAHGSRFRLSLPDGWGAPCRAPGLAEGQVTFSYSSALSAAQILSGEAYARLRPARGNPFEAGSDVIIVSSFGIDNAVPMLIGVVGVGVAQPRWRPPDRYLVNYFYTLAGEKFSTNRGHAIWAADVCAAAGLSTDLFRAYMVRINPEFAMDDFDPAGFVAGSNALVEAVDAALAHAEAALGRTEAGTGASTGAGPGTIDPAVARLLTHALDRQAMAMDLDAFHLAAIRTPIDDWLAAAPAYAVDPRTAYWWLKGLALLAWPVMPRFGAWLWHRCGHDGAPSGAAFGEPRPIRPAAGPCPLGRPIAHRDLAACLPPALRRPKPAEAPENRGDAGHVA